MYRLITLAGALILALPSNLQAQQARDVTGRVVNSNDSTPIVGVRITVVELRTRVLSDSAGRFTLRNLPRTAFRLAFARVGVTTDTVLLNANLDTLVVRLSPSAVELDPIVARAVPAARQRFEEIAQTSTMSINRDVVTTTPGLFEPDVIRIVQLLPGTVAINDYTVGFHTRGGEADQNLVQLDGVPIFNPSHLGGLFSTFDAAAVENVDFITGGFPARYGGRLSSVLDISLRPGRERLHLTGQTSLLSTKLLIEGKIPATAGTYLAGGRRTYADKVVAALTREELPYYFTDGIAKVTFPLGDGTIAATGYAGRDVLDWEFVEATPERTGIDLEINWGNQLVALNVQQRLNKTDLAVHLSASRFSTTIALSPGLAEIDNDLRYLAARASLGFPIGATHNIQMGVGVEDYRMLYDFSSAALNTNFFALQYQPRVWSAFIDDQWEPVEWLKLRPGIRFEAVDGAGFSSFAPRVNAKAFITSNFALTGSAGRYYQPIHSLKDHNAPWSFVDFWIGADDNTPVARSDHLVIGFESWFGGQVSLSVEGYRKTFENIINFNFTEDPKIQGDEFVPMRGDASGVDVLLRKHTGRTNGWLAYSYGRATRHLEEQTFHPTHDRRHTINLVLQTPGILRSIMGLRWGYGSPLPYTDFVGQWRHREYSIATDSFFDRDEEPIANPQLNSVRYPHYSRLDVSFRWRTNAWGGVLSPYVQFVNLYNRGNVFLYAFEFTNRPPTRTGVTQIPLFPSFGLEFEF